VCDTAEHKCHAPPGKVLVDSIKIYTASCTDCQASDEGVIVKLLGEKNGNYLDGVPCSTNSLDHKSTHDFDKGEATFDGRKGGHFDHDEQVMMGSCFEGALNSQLNGGNITWSGSAGTWSPQPTGGICVDWRDGAAFPWACDLKAQGGVWNIENCDSLMPALDCP